MVKYRDYANLHNIEMMEIFSYANIQQKDAQAIWSLSPGKTVPKCSLTTQPKATGQMFFVNPPNTNY
jgi:hypothetical protein